jgi:hypothetical protein
MPRMQTQRVNPIGLGAPGESSVRSGVFAAPNAQAGKAVMSPEVEGLLRGLSSLSAANAAVENDRERDRAKETAAGRDFGRSGGQRGDAEVRGKSFMEGYIEGGGEAAAIADAEELAARYQSDVPKDAADIQQFVGEFYQGKMKGNKDPVFQRGYDRIFGAEALKLRSKHGEGLALALVDKRMTEAQTRLDHAAKSLVGQGQPLGDAFLAAANTLATEVRLSPIEKDEMILRTVETYGGQGIAAAYEVTKAPRKDPVTGAYVPPMYDNPRWRERIEKGIREAERVALTKDTARLKAEEKAREDSQETAVGEVYQLMLSGKVEEGEAVAYKLMQNRSLFTRASEIHKFVSMIKQAATDISKPGELEAESTHLMSIYEGTLKTRLAISKLSDVGPATKMRLITRLDSHLSRLASDARDERRTSAAERTAAGAWSKDPIYKRAEDIIEDQLKPAKGPFADISNDPNSLADRDALALAKMELANLAAQNPGADAVQYQQWALDIVKRNRDARGDPMDDKTQRTRAARSGVPFKDMRELVAAKDRLDPQSYLMYRRILMPLEPQGKPK